MQPSPQEYVQSQHFTSTADIMAAMKKMFRDVIGKYDRNAESMEDKILALYACGMSQRDIAEQIKSLYDVEISPELVSKISLWCWASP